LEGVWCIGALLSTILVDGANVCGQLMGSSQQECTLVFFFIEETC